MALNTSDPVWQSFFNTSALKELYLIQRCNGRWQKLEIINRGHRHPTIQRQSFVSETPESWICRFIVSGRSTTDVPLQAIYGALGFDSRCEMALADSVLLREGLFCIVREHQPDSTGLPTRCFAARHVLHAP
jgi:hypothetical protein